MARSGRATPSPRARPRSTAAGFDWVVVESLPIHEASSAATAIWPALFANYRQSMANLAAEGIKTICYNFMPLLDWTRTDLPRPLARGGTCLRFIRRADGRLRGPHAGPRRGRGRLSARGVRTRPRSGSSSRPKPTATTLLQPIMAGLPGAFDRYDIAGPARALDRYDGIGPRRSCAPTTSASCEESSPRPKIWACGSASIPTIRRAIFSACRASCRCARISAGSWRGGQSAANGLTLCSGSLGANPANDVPAIARRFADRIHFAHLRNVARTRTALSRKRRIWTATPTWWR